MILFDFDTNSRWKREKFSIELLKECTVYTEGYVPFLNPIDVQSSPLTQAKYESEKAKLFKQIEAEMKDPHAIPRNLYLLSGKDKLLKVDRNHAYIGRNNRFKIERMQTYKEVSYSQSPYTVFEFPHNYIDFVDFLSLSRQTSIDVLRGDLKVENYYWTRYQEWLKNLKDAQTSIH
jgi:hypothetical protein